jgi:hypothetical protein
MFGIQTLSNLLTGNPDWHAPTDDPGDLLPYPMLLPGDIAVTPDGQTGLITRIGWRNGEPSPYYGETETRAYVIGLDANGELWNDWVILEDIKPADIVEERDFIETLLASDKQRVFHIDFETETAETEASAVAAW